MFFHFSNFKMNLKIREILFMAKNDFFCQFSIFPFSKPIEKNTKMEYTCGHCLFFYFLIFNQKQKKHQNIEIYSIEFSIFPCLSKNGKRVVVSVFCYDFHFLGNWRNAIDLVKHTVLILNVLCLLKYLAFNGGRQASSVQGQEML